MMEIKFRAWAIASKIMFNPDEENGWTISNGEVIAKPNTILMQFTGLLDKNGLADIYEDDIINSEGLVIGNKYQNYELLKESTNFLIQGFGTEDWETTNKKAMERGCKYPKRYADKNEF